MKRESVLFGEIKFYKPSDGYGFIKHAAITKDIHFGKESVAEKVDHNSIKTPGVQVKFKLRENRKGLEAFEVAPLHRPYKLLVDFDREKVDGGTFVKGITVNNATIWLSVREDAVFATAENPNPEYEEHEDEEDFWDPLFEDRDG